MTYFREELIKKALKMIHELVELADVLNDLDRAEKVYIEIGNALTQIAYYQSLQRARTLNEELRQKYKGIQEMLAFANALPPIPSFGRENTAASKCNEQILLEQDYFGILFDTLKKKGEIEEAEAFIDHVEE